MVIPRAIRPRMPYPPRYRPPRRRFSSGTSRLQAHRHRTAPRHTPDSSAVPTRPPLIIHKGEGASGRRSPQEALRRKCQRELPASRLAMRSSSHSSTSVSNHTTRFWPSRTRLGNFPAASSRAMCCGEYGMPHTVLSSFFDTTRFENIEQLPFKRERRRSGCDSRTGGHYSLRG